MALHHVVLVYGHICSQVLDWQIHMALNSLIWGLCAMILLHWIIWPYSPIAEHDYIAFLHSHSHPILPCWYLWYVQLAGVGPCQVLVLGFSSNIHSQYTVFMLNLTTTISIQVNWASGTGIMLATHAQSLMWEVWARVWKWVNFGWTLSELTTADA